MIQEHDIMTPGGQKGLQGEGLQNRSKVIGMMERQDSDFHFLKFLNLSPNGQNRPGHVRIGELRNGLGGDGLWIPP
jgi:hypothetical protein